MHCLCNANITTIGELARMSDSDLLRLRNFGPKRLKEVRGKLADLMSRDLIDELTQTE
jgi:DNA-directed RNA polymerase alpha subunit